MKTAQMNALDILKENLPTKYIVALIGNLDDKSILDSNEYTSILSCLINMFKWKDSIEGEPFWTDVYNAILSGGELPEIPFRADWSPNSYVSLDVGNILINLNGEGEDIEIRLSGEISNFYLPEDMHSRIICEKHFAFCN